MAGPVDSAKPKCPEGWCSIPEGSFKMGSPQNVGEEREHPQRTITESAFEIQRTEVPVGAYRKSLKPGHGAEQSLKFVLSGCGSSGSSRTVESKNGETLTLAQLRQRALQIAGMQECNSMSLVQEQVASTDIEKVLNWSENKQGDDYPVVGLTLPEEEAYCQSLGSNVHVISEAQYECAARGVSGTDEYGNSIDKAIIYDNGARGAAPVPGPNDKERCNSFGVCDLAGNVWERTSDVFDENFYSRMPDKDPVNPLDPTSKQSGVFRGGSWVSGQGFARAAYRFDDYPDVRSYVVGFRCARPQDSKK